MICTNCGASMMETDQFCPKCGAKAIKDRRCPDCGAVLRDGVKFCPKCGRLIGGSGKTAGVSGDTLDIPIDAIERNILSETAAEIKADRRETGTHRKPVPRSEAAKSSSPRNSSGKAAGSRGSSSHSASERSTAQRSAPAKKREPMPEPPRKKKVVYREEDWEDEDWEDDDWDEDDDDDEEGVDVITVMTAVIGCVLLVVVAVLGFNLFRQYVPKDYDKVAEEQQKQEEQEQERAPEEGETAASGDTRETYALTITHNVNVRDNPDTNGTNIIKVAQEGETYTSYGAVDGGEWYEILLEDGTTGYVFHEYVSIE